MLTLQQHGAPPRLRAIELACLHGWCSHRAFDVPKKLQAIDVKTLSAELTEEGGWPADTDRSPTYLNDLFHIARPAQDRRKWICSLPSVKEAVENQPLGMVWFPRSSIVLGEQAGRVAAELLAYRRMREPYAQRDSSTSSLREIVLFALHKLDLLEDTTVLQDPGKIKALVAEMRMCKIGLSTLWRSPLP